MYRTLVSGLQRSLRLVLLASTGITALNGALPVRAQSPAELIDPVRYPACQPPAANEYLLLVVSKTQSAQAQVKQVLPANTSSTVCNYLSDVVTRVNGFSNQEAANSWAKYLTEMVGLPAFVAKSSAIAAQVPQAEVTRSLPETPAQTSTQTSLAYNPQPLGEGYAVLVNYFNQPEMATQIQQLLGQQIGLAAYGQRPYLLATYTPSQQDASSVSQALNDRGFSTIIVDSRQVTLLKEVVSSQ